MKSTDLESSENTHPAEGAPENLVRIDDYSFPGGWSDPREAPARARQCCEQLEDGKVLYFENTPFLLFKEDRDFLLSQRQSGSRLHKNVSYRPVQDILRGAAGSQQDTIHLHEIMGKCSSK